MIEDGWQKGKRWSMPRVSLIAMAVLVTAGAVPARAALELPPIVEPATQERHVGKVVFEELVTPDIAAAKRFYGGLFGWTFRDIIKGGIRYSEVLANGRPIAGMLQKELPPGQQRRPSWLTFISVENVEAASTSARAHGAKVLLEPRLIRDRGMEAVLADPQGAVFAVLASTAGDPPDLLAAAGEWIWSSLAVADPDRDAGFYQKLLDYEVFELPSGASATQHYLLASENLARASVNQLPRGNEGGPRWINYVRVNDAEAIARKAERLGGRILVEPRPDRQGGKLAIIADPQGAPFGVMEWKEQGEEVVQ